MGMYTEIVCGFDLKKEAPEVVINALKWMMGDIEKPAVLPEHELFGKDRVDLLFRCSSFYFGFSESHSAFKFNDISESWMLSVRANIKNYDGEIEAFFDWIRSYVDHGSGDRETNFIGYSIYEEAAEPTLYYARWKAD